MQTSSSNPVRFQPDDSYIIPGNSLTQPPQKQSLQKKGCLNNHKVEKYEPASNFSSDKLHQSLATDSNRKSLQRYKLLRERISIGLDHRFAGSEKTFIRNLYIKAGSRVAVKTFAAFCSVIGMGTLISATYSSAVTPAFAGALGAGLSAGAAGVSALCGYVGRTFDLEKYHLHKWVWFHYFVDKQHRELFLKEVPEPDDIIALEDLVSRIKDKLAPEQIDETHKDMKKTINIFDYLWFKYKQHTEAPLVLDIYLELAKQRCAKHHSASISVGVKCENPDNSSNNIPVAKLVTRSQYV